MAFTAELPMGLPTPAYFIYRDTPPGQPIDPAAPPTFFPPKDSDELFDALRAKYPNLKTHSERMRDAIIEFLLEERMSEQIQRTSPTASFNNLPTWDTSMTPSTFETTTTSPWPSQSWPSMSSGSTSTFSSPETLGLATPTFSMSPHSQAPQLNRHHSTAASTTTTPTEMTPPALENMTGVFSVCSSDQPKQRIRRKMTEAEKIEYRQRRIVKACEKCQRRKRKCQHNQPEVDSLTATSKKQNTTTATNRVVKPQHQRTPKKTVVATPKLQEINSSVDIEGFNFDQEFGTDMQLFDDFANFLDEPAGQLEFQLFDQFGLAPQNGGDNGNRAHDGRGQLRWDDAPHDWSLPNADVNQPHQTCLDISGSMQHTTGGRNLQTATAGHNANTNEALIPNSVQAQAYDAAHEGYMVLKTDAHPHLLFSTINTRGHPQGDPETGRQEPNGNGMLWEHLRTGQVKTEPKLSAHGLDTEGQAAYVYDSTGRCTNGSRAEPSTTLSQGATSYGLPSTSVARPSGTLLKEESAARQQGRPQTTLGESGGVACAMSPSTELYRLKRRLSISKKSHRFHDFVIPRDSHATGRPSLSLSQANGGAYLRLEMDNATSSSISIAESSSSAATQSEQTAARNIPPTSSDGSAQSPASYATSSRSHTSLRRPLQIVPSQGGAGAPTETGIDTRFHSVAPREAEAIIPQSIAYGELTCNNVDVHEIRLRDTFRRRDHFGRVFASGTSAASADRAGSDLPAVFAVLGGLLMLAALLPLAHGNIALLALALAAPVPGAKGTHFRDRAWSYVSQVWGTMLQCTIKNSSWLGLFSRRCAEAATESLPAGCWWDEMWPEGPGTRGEGEVRVVGGV